jgi:hypothetical protein
MTPAGSGIARRGRVFGVRVPAAESFEVASLEAPVWPAHRGLTGTELSLNPGRFVPTAL